jgi:hypothetical protein
MAMATLGDVVKSLKTPGKDGYSDIDKMVLNPMSQFGPDDSPYMLAELIPDQQKPKNMYTEGQITYRRVIGNAGTNYSPAIINPGGQIMGFFDVNFGVINQADEIDAATYENIMDILQLSTDGSNLRDIRAAAEVIRWIDQRILSPLDDLKELYRAQSLIDGQVQRKGVNGYAETVVYANAGQRLNISGGTIASPAGWYKQDGSYDPITDFRTVKKLAADKGYDLQGIYSNYIAFAAFMDNASIKTRFNNAVILQNSQISSLSSNVDETAIQGLLARQGLPGWKQYNKGYNYRDASRNIQRTGYLDRPGYDPVIITCKTKQSLQIDIPLSLGKVNLANTLGYMGVGRVLGQTRIGRFMNAVVAADRYPESLYAEAFEMCLPVLTAPDAFFVLKVYRPA